MGHRARRRFRNDRGDGPRGTPTIDGDRIYALGGNGDLSALELKYRQARLDQERPAGVWRLEYHLGNQRVAARDR
jgi:hypothetical protein